jgi:hypothetical protein
VGTQSKHSRRRMQQSGLGGRLRVVHRMPRLARRLPGRPELDAEMEYRLRCLEHAHRTSVADAARVVGRSRATVYRWRTRYDPTDLRSRRPRSRRPHRTRRQQWTPAQEQAVWDLRPQVSCSGKAKLVHLRRDQGTRLSVSTIGRILASLKRRTLLIEPHAVRVRQRRASRPYATRVPTDRRQPYRTGAARPARHDAAATRTGCRAPPGHRH